MRAPSVHDLSGSVLILLALCCSGEPAQAKTVSGTARVISGEILEVAGRRLRLAGIDAPEPGQICTWNDRTFDCGKVSATALMDLTAGVPVTCEVLDDGVPPPARCHTPDGYDLSEGMVYTGWALAFPRQNNPLLEQEEIARKRRHGMWRGRFVPPWEWRDGAKRSHP